MIPRSPSSCRARLAAAVCCAALLLSNSARAADCQPAQLATAVDAAGEKLRQLTSATQPTLQARLRQLKEVKGWSDTEYEEKGYAALEDARTAKLDAAANELLARIDTLGAEPANAAPDCARIADIEAVSLELQATVRAKGQYVIERLDQLIAEAKPGAATASAPAVAAAPPAPAPVPSKADPRWSTQTKATAPVAPPPAPPPIEVAIAVPMPPPVIQAPPTADAEGFSIDEIVAASSGLFGKVSANLARVLEHAFAKSGRPTGYILGQETGGAFIAGLRYGSGQLYLRSGLSLPVYWHGPSIGADVGAQGAATLFLVYKLGEPSDVFASFTGLEGSAYVIGGVGMTFMSNGKIQMAPIRSGLGLRVGANLGYIRFTSKPTWNPF